MDDIREIRRTLEMTQAELAEALGLNQSTISRLESGALILDARTRLAIEAIQARRGANSRHASDPSSGKIAAISQARP